MRPNNETRQCRQRGCNRAGRYTVDDRRPRNRAFGDAEQHDGILAGFQLWINVAEIRKMTAAAYQEHDANDEEVVFTGLPVCNFTIERA
jgi:hypothetical protein